MHKKTATSIQTWQTCQMHWSANSKTRLQQHKSDLNTDFHINHINWLYVLIRFIYVHDSYIRTHSSKSRTYTSSLNWMQLPRLIRQVSHRREMRGGREATVETAKCVHFVCRQSHVPAGRNRCPRPGPVELAKHQIEMTTELFWLIVNSCHTSTTT